MKNRSPRSFATAIYNIVQKLGAKVCASAVNRSSALIYKWADPEATTVPTLSQALVLDREYVRRGLGPPPVLVAYAAMLKEELQAAGADLNPSSAKAVNDIAQLMVIAAQTLRDFSQAHLSARSDIAQETKTPCNICNNLRQLGETGASLEWQITQDKSGRICPISNCAVTSVVCLKQDA